MHLRTCACMTALALIASSCDRVFGPLGYACTDQANASIVVYATDAITGEGVAAGSTLILQAGSYVDSILVDGSFPASEAGWLGPTNTYERTGFFTVRVRHPSYQLWEQRGVWVTRDKCHVRTVRIDARLRSNS